MQDEMSDKAQKELLMEYSDQLRLSMAANLQDYHMENFKVSVISQHLHEHLSVCLSVCKSVSLSVCNRSVCSWHEVCRLCLAA